MSPSEPMVYLPEFFIAVPLPHASQLIMKIGGNLMMQSRKKMPQNMKLMRKSWVYNRTRLI